MKKLFLITSFLFISIGLFAPDQKKLIIELNDPIIPFDKMLWSFMKVESNFDTDTVNRLGYGGILQIGQEMIDEANRLNVKDDNPVRYTLNDRLDSLKSVQIWYTVQNYWNPTYSLKRAAKVWNPLASNKYYNKLKINLNNPL